MDLAGQGSTSQILSLGMSKTFRPWKIDEPLLLEAKAGQRVAGRLVGITEAGRRPLQRAEMRDVVPSLASA